MPPLSCNAPALWSFGHISYILSGLLLLHKFKKEELSVFIRARPSVIRLVAGCKKHSAFAYQREENSDFEEIWFVQKREKYLVQKKKLTGKPLSIMHF